MEPAWRSPDERLELWQGDCLVVIPELIRRGYAFDLCVTSPPYAQGKEYEEGLDWQGLRLLVAMAGALSFHALKPSGFMAVNFGETSRYQPRTMGELYATAMCGVGFLWHSRRLFRKPIAKVKLPLSSCNLSVPCAELEEFWTFRKPPNTREQDIPRRLSNRQLWEPTPYEASEKVYREHPAAFPMWLPRRAMRCWSRPDDLVLDPFGGVATTLVACYHEDRRGIAIELRDDYCERAIERLEHIVTQGRLFAPTTATTRDAPSLFSGSI